MTSIKSNQPKFAKPVGTHGPHNAPEAPKPSSSEAPAAKAGWASGSPSARPPVNARAGTASQAVIAPPAQQPAVPQHDVISGAPNNPATSKMQSTALGGVDTLGDPKNIDEAFDQLVSSASGPAEVRRHVDNVGAWNMKWDLVNKAEKTFDFSYFSIERDAYGEAYMGALLAARMRGVEVSGITDYMANSRGHGFVSTGLGGDYMQELASYGAKIGLYDPPSKRAESLLKDGVTYKAMSSDHDKLCVADAGTPNAEGETGGRNVAGAYHQDPKDNPGSWRDDSLQIKGPVTDGLVTALRRELDGPAVKMVKPDFINFKPRATEMLGAYQLMDTWVKAGPLSGAERSALSLPPGPGENGAGDLTTADKAAIHANPQAKDKLAAMLLDGALKNLHNMPNVPEAIRSKKLTDGEMKQLTKNAKELANDLELRGSKAKYDTMGGYMKADVKIMDQVGAASAAPGERYNEMAPDMLHLIRGAQKEIVIQNPYVVLTEPMVKELENASKRGVKITIVTNSPESTDSAVTQGYFLNDWKNVEARVPNARIFVATGERKFHAKAFVLDGKVSGDTSYNADLLSGMVNGEVGAVTRSEASAQDLMKHIAEDLADPANKFKEWSIERNADGSPKLDAKGEPIAHEGPEQDVSKKLQRIYGPVQYLCDLLTKTSLGSPLAVEKARRDD